MTNIYSKLGRVQVELHAPKNQNNDFGKYKYRSAEDILEAVKPVLEANGLALVVSDTIELVGDRVYVHAKAAVYDVGSGEFVAASGWAREAADKKGMDSAQVTGATSSYARKYALNGLLSIDDAKDPDSNEHRRQVDSAPKAKPAAKSAGSTVELIKAAAKLKGLSKEQVDAHVRATHGGSLDQFLGNEVVLQAVLGWVKA